MLNPIAATSEKHLRREIDGVGGDSERKIVRIIMQLGSCEIGNAGGGIFREENQRRTGDTTPWYVDGRAESRRR